MSKERGKYIGKPKRAFIMMIMMMMIKNITRGLSGQNNATLPSLKCLNPGNQWICYLRWQKGLFRYD